MATKTYIARETPIVWSDSGADEVLTFNGLAAGAVRVGARHDFGDVSAPDEFEGRLNVRFETAPVIGEYVHVYLSSSDGLKEDGGVGTVDAAGDVAALENLTLICSLKVTSTDADHDMTKSGVGRLVTRYGSPVIYNKTADGLKATDNVCTFTMTFLSQESQ